MRDIITLACTDCKNRNYTTTKNKKTTPDKLDALVNDISIGLPAEIAARRQQYAYYRDLLLSFPKPQEA